MCVLVNRIPTFWNTEEPAWGVKILVPLLKKEGFDVGHEPLCGVFAPKWDLKPFIPIKTHQNRTKTPGKCRIYCEI